MGPRGANRNYTYKLTRGKELMICGSSSLSRDDKDVLSREIRIISQV